MHESIIISQGIATKELPRGVWKGNDLLNISQQLFRGILAEEDPRWQIVKKYQEAQQEARFKPIHFENAMLATYLSEEVSYRNKYLSYGRIENLRHLCRAINNVSAYPSLKELYHQTEDTVDLPDDLTMEFARTDRLLSGTDRKGITGCPEALYQLRMFQGDRYIARIGFNTHPEAEQMVWSITNMQGIPNGTPAYTALCEEFGVSPFNVLVQRLQTMSEASSVPTELRGLKNPKKIESSGLYNATFTAQGIRRMSFKRSVEVIE